LTQRLHREISEELGTSCLIELVPRHTLPRTSSGKLSRAAARADYLQRRAQERKAARADGDKPSYGEQAGLPATAGP
jgi:fatty-acyl-CoA synthase